MADQEPAFMGEDLLEKQAFSRCHADDTFEFPDAPGATSAPAKKAAKKATKKG